MPTPRTPRTPPKLRPCANECGNMVDARRAQMGVIGKQNFALCEWCNEANLPSFRPPVAQYEQHDH